MQIYSFIQKFALFRQRDVYSLVNIHYLRQHVGETHDVLACFMFL